MTGCCRDGVDPEWFPRTCCSKHAKYDKRTQGLFKIEYEGDAMIGLCSKTHIVQKTTTIHTSSTAMSAFRLLRRAKRLPPKRLVNRPRLVREVNSALKDHQALCQSTDDHLPLRLEHSTRGTRHTQGIQSP